MKQSKVAVCMSGGVDSSITALLLKEKYSVTGVFARFFPEAKGEENARKVCDTLGIPFQVLDLQKEFKDKVIKSLLQGLKKGITPNPCVFCNKEIKFGELLRHLSEFDFVATGHYIRKKDNRLFVAKDKEKDQSYFLWMLDKKEIKKVIFPLGEYKKSEVRKMASKMNLPVGKESQNFCFGNVSHLIKDSPGKIVNKKGSVLGEHKGSSFYTTGQRKGLDLPGGPYYVLEKRGSTVIVTKEKKDLYQKEVELKDVNIKEEVPLEVEARIRYGSPLKRAVLKKDKLTFLSPQFAVCSGQSAVFYRDGELLGGGIIK